MRQVNSRLHMKDRHIRTGKDSSVAVSESDNQRFLEDPSQAPPEIRSQYRQEREDFKRTRGAYPETLFDPEMMD